MPSLYRLARLVNADTIKPFNSGTPPPCYFRTNKLNDRTPQRIEPRYGHPVPTATIQGRPCYVFDHMAFPVDDHLPSLLATAHHPDDTYTYKLVDRNGRAPTTPAPLRVPTATLTDLGLDIYRNLPGDHIYRLKMASSIVGVDTYYLVRPVIEAGLARNDDFIPRRKTAFSNAAEYAKMYEEVTTVIRTTRTAQIKLTGHCDKFSIRDLVHEDCPGGYPTHCPVTGYELEWLMPSGTSHFSPRIGRKDTRAGYVSGNVVLMASIAKRLLDGSTQPVHHANFLAHYPDIMPGVARWIQTHNADTNTTPNTNTAPTTTLNA